LDSAGIIDQATAIALSTTNLEKALGLNRDGLVEELVAYYGGGILDLESKVIGVVSATREIVELF
jgi:hypothetical protein